MNTLLIASKSKSRQMLLSQAGIKFSLVEQDADEAFCQTEGSLSEIVSKIALQKMNSAIIPNGTLEGQQAFILSADTMGVSSNGKICGKPNSKEEAIDMIRSYRAGAETCTAFCLDKILWKNGAWVVEQRIQKAVSAKYIFDVPEDEIERYFKLSIDAGLDFMCLSGAVAIEEFGAQYLKSLNGSYTAVVGLPMYELREALIQLGFKF